MLNFTSILKYCLWFLISEISPDFECIILLLDIKTHEDDEYRWAGVEDPKVVITTSHNPSVKLKQFVKVREIMFYTYNKKSFLAYLMYPFYILIAILKNLNNKKHRETGIKWWPIRFFVCEHHEKFKIVPILKGVGARTE